MKKQITLFIFITMVVAVVTLKKVSMQGAGYPRKTIEAAQAHVR